MQPKFVMFFPSLVLAAACSVGTPDPRLRQQVPATITPKTLLPYVHDALLSDCETLWAAHETQDEVTQSTEQNLLLEVRSYVAQDCEEAQHEGTVVLQVVGGCELSEWGNRKAVCDVDWVLTPVDGKIYLIEDRLRYGALEPVVHEYGPESVCRRGTLHAADGLQ